MPSRLSYASAALLFVLLAGCTSQSGDSPATEHEASGGAAPAPTRQASSGGQLSGDESDVGCGGTAAGIPRCAAGKTCKGAGDCASGVCTTGVCAAPGATDGVKNGDETDVDCGGANAPKCDVGKRCARHSDCASDGCAYDGTCAAGRSCTQHFGGDTCGPGEVGNRAAKHVSCCESAPLFGEMQDVALDRFLITAGRMRAFIERLDGNVRGFVHTLPADAWSPDWDDQLVPSNVAEANEQLGSFFGKKSCHPGDHTGRTYWTPAAPDDVSDFSRDELDTKALNCVTWQLVAAFCAWDGGRMPSSDELRNAFTEGGKYTQPWLWRPGAAPYVQPPGDDAQAPPSDTFNHGFSYGFPIVPNMRRDDNGQPGLDAAFYVSPPGRFPQSWNEHGHEIAGNLLTWNSSGPFVATRNYSWENHGGDDLSDTDWRAFEQTDVNLPNGYYAIGGRCARGRAR